MIVGLGTDIIECDRIAALIERHGESFTHRVFTPAERAYCDKHKNSAQNYAGRWAAKEAAMKALGTGFVPPVGWHDFEILPQRSGAPTMTLTGGAAEVLTSRGGSVEGVMVTISHCRAYATATVILLG
ncbi:holo-ACP synthase [Alienimonas sp. DA493]|uniref:holo-ACP synthase n=1 Tax=Alienimonas sp. DA493 TaxID=3373605 RepID=UPI0037543DD3